MTGGTSEDLEVLARKVIEDERSRGHGRLADELEGILRQAKGHKVTRGLRDVGDRQIRELPLSRRHREFLVTICPRESLDHHMVLAPAVEERFARIEREFAARERLTTFGLRPRRTILLYGPPGCGKSLGAKRLAWNTGLPLMKVRLDALLSSFFGESASNLRAIFDAVRESPCLLLLDECDFLAKSRVDTKDIGEAGRVVNSLLQLLEEYDAPGLLVATTNVEHSLDEALFRRFDEVFQVPLPGATEIERLLRLTLASVRTEPGIDWRRLVERLQGMTAAHVVKGAQDAAKAAVLAGEQVVGERHLSTAISELDVISSGRRP